MLIKIIQKGDWVHINNRPELSSGQVTPIASINIKNVFSVSSHTSYNYNLGSESKLSIIIKSHDGTKEEILVNDYEELELLHKKIYENL
jgi:hypothetical protein